MRQLKLRQLGLAFSLGTMLLVGCGQKKCQPAAEQPFQSIIDTAWRMVESTDPIVKNNTDNYNFIVMTFGINRLGMMQKVVNNDLFENPLYNLRYDINPSNKTLTVNYEEPPAPPADGGQPPSAEPVSTTVVQYTYKIGKELELTEVKSGNYHRLVPYQGVVEPDRQCTF